MADGYGARRFRARKAADHHATIKFNFPCHHSFAIRYSPFVITFPTPVSESLSRKIHEIQLCSANLFFS